MNGKPLSIVRIRHIEELNSMLYLSSKNKEKTTRLLGDKSKRETSLVYKLMLRAGESTFS